MRYRCTWQVAVASLVVACRSSCPPSCLPSPPTTSSPSSTTLVQRASTVTQLHPPLTVALSSTRPKHPCTTTFVGAPQTATLTLSTTLPFGRWCSRAACPSGQPRAHSTAPCLQKSTSCSSLALVSTTQSCPRSSAGDPLSHRTRCATVTFSRTPFGTPSSPEPGVSPSSVQRALHVRVRLAAALAVTRTQLQRRIAGATLTAAAAAATATHLCVLGRYGAVRADHDGGGSRSRCRISRVGWHWRPWHRLVAVEAALRAA
mmetsp:Transcript_14964/g.46825  ORF Transcript_14964/g.46825 Transcript_14964/m.46825 type:complete len:260 (+) Transcript_14964:287-1066(+)